MTTSEILRAVTKALRAEGIGAQVMRLSALSKREGCVVRPQPARVVTQYISGDAEVEQQVRAICKRRSAERAMADAEACAGAMDGMVVVGERGDRAILSCDGDAYQELELNESDFTIWEARATARYMRRSDAR